MQLSAEQEQSLKGMTSKGSSKARVMTRARILLMTHRQMSDADIKNALGISVQMVQLYTWLYHAHLSHTPDTQI